MEHKCGFVNIIGKPNVGKSTLMNAIVGEKLSIITPKQQTTRHRVMGIVNGEDFQIVYSDTPGIIDSKYKLHEKMMGYVSIAMQDADVFLFVTDIYKTDKEAEILKRIIKTEIPFVVVINKIDLTNTEILEENVDYWKQYKEDIIIVPISAKEKFNIDTILNLILKKLPVAHPYFPKDQLTDKPEKFFVSEIIREKIFTNYEKEIPYSCEVEVESFVDEKKIVKIRANIIIERDSQKGILIGKEGRALKRVGTEARKDMEDFLGKKVFLELYVKVDKDWRNNERKLKNYGYNLS